MLTFNFMTTSRFLFAHLVDIVIHRVIFRAIAQQLNHGRLISRHFSSLDYCLCLRVSECSYFIIFGGGKYIVKTVWYSRKLRFTVLFFKFIKKKTPKEEKKKHEIEFFLNRNRIIIILYYIIMIISIVFYCIFI
jgi:hypothetical protein